VAAINAGKFGVTATQTDATHFTLSSANSNLTVADTATGDFAAAPSNATSAQYYSISVSAGAGVYDGSAATQIEDSSTGGGTANVGLVANSNGTGGIATISYSDAAGQSLNQTDLSNQTDARGALTALNAAISDVAAQDGYIGAQINTLNAVSSVISTQAQNVTAAQNAVQATDYASATSNMSKYEILSQTGISALAQANSMQQEVTKLLQ
jgi:flagellin